MSIVYVTLLLAALLAVASLAVDYGRVQLAKTQLQTATDAAAKWAAQSIRDGHGAAVAMANDAAGDNHVDGVALSFTSSNVELGTWDADARVFSASANPPHHAVKLNAVATVPLMLGSVINKPAVTLHASAIATSESSAGFVGLSRLEFKNNTFIGSYDSRLTTLPTHATAARNAVIASNGVITGGNNGLLLGDAHYGPAGSVDLKAWSITGNTEQLASPLAAPIERAWAPAGNPGSVTNGHYTHAGGMLNGGTYWFTGLTVDRPLAFNTAATIYVNGDIALTGNNAAIVAFLGRPGNVTIYQLGANRKFTVDGDAMIQAVVVAPGSSFEANNKLNFYGQFLFDSFILKNNANLFFDESAAITQSIALVQ